MWKKLSIMHTIGMGLFYRFLKGDVLFMFWESVLNGLGLYQNYEVWLTILAIAIINLVIFFIFGAVGLNSETAAGTTVLFLGFPVVSSIANIILLPFATAFMLPLLLGVGEVGKISELLGDWKVLLIAGVVALILSLIISLIPFIGKLFAIPGVDRFVQLSVIFIMLISSSASDETKFIELPSFWPSIGFMILTAVIAYIFMVLVVLLTSFLNEDIAEFLGGILGLSSGYIVGFSAFFMYTQYFILLNH
jgi:hypothetical protein